MVDMDLIDWRIFVALKDEKSKEFQRLLEEERFYHNNLKVVPGLGGRANS